MQPISTVLSAASNPSGVETLFIVNRTVFWIAFASTIKHTEMLSVQHLLNLCEERDIMFGTKDAYILISNQLKAMGPRTYKKQEKAINKTLGYKQLPAFWDIQVSSYYINYSKIIHESSAFG